MTDKFSGIFKAELPVLIERRFCTASYCLAAVFNVCVMKIKCENMVFCELLLFRIFTHCCFFHFWKFFFLWAVSYFLPSLLFLSAGKHLHHIPLVSILTSFTCLLKFSFALFPSFASMWRLIYLKQEVLPDRKRVTTRSYLPISPLDTDSGRNFTCVASNPAVPLGKRATVTLNIHRMSLCTFLFFCVSGKSRIWIRIKHEDKNTSIRLQT